MNRLFVFHTIGRSGWWLALERLLDALESGTGADRREVEGLYALLLRELIAERHPSLLHAAAGGLLQGEAVLEVRSGVPLPEGLRRAAVADIEFLLTLLKCDWQQRVSELSGRTLPQLRDLASDTPREVNEWARRLSEESAESLLEALIERYRTSGTGVFANHLAFRWRSGRLEGVAHPTRDRLGELVGLERQLDRLLDNVERFLAGSPALDTLLYGPRGSGKSTAARALLDRYAQRGLRLVEVSPEGLAELPQLSETLRAGPHRYLVFIDDLSFEAGETSFRPLKSLLEGSVSERPENLLLLATSNRRHLVRERFSDRPLPENDDVHRWDSSNELLALSDRFGLTITFPAADQREFLRLVRDIAKLHGVEIREAELEKSALAFAEWGNGYSGRTARQFVDTLR